MMQRFSLLLLLVTAQFGLADSLEAAMSRAAKDFVSRLSSAQVEAAVLDFEDPRRTNWHYFPTWNHPRQGVTYHDLSAAQQKSLAALLSVVLSKEGVRKLAQLRSLETIQKELTGQWYRDPDEYYFTLFGEPKAKGTWGWRLEGYHLSLNYTIEKGLLTSITPQFWGASPDRVPSGRKKGMRLLEERDTLAQRFYQSLTAEQQGEALISTHPPRNLVSRPNQKASRIEPLGLSSRQLNESQQKRLFKIVEHYLSMQPPEITRSLLQELSEMKHYYFAAAGDILGTGARYYRIQCGEYLIEYCNVQGQGNHSHTVLRAAEQDFGTKD